MTVLGLSFHAAVENIVCICFHKWIHLWKQIHTMFQPLYGRTVPELSLIVYF
ncbi:unnamed protein product [Staurois parvus]|uniref:Uncharacterized protein n=1 Tax=Staurois parvus TaxID=386267 RepID=A0ABN9BDM5_9NEOB|nr:unnamed protein product [Staurois parvus]